ncbi:MAG: preprotein translocase subunit YajC [Pseudonocardia sp.]
MKATMENFGSLLFLALIALLFIPIILNGRRQKKAVSEMQALQAALEVGDVVVTTSGLRGTVVDASYEDTIDLEIAEGVITTWVRAAVREKIADDAPATPGTETGTTSDADAAHS